MQNLGKSSLSFAQLPRLTWVSVVQVPRLVVARMAATMGPLMVTLVSSGDAETSETAETAESAETAETSVGGS